MPISVYNYKNYRQYLEDFYQQEKSSAPSFTYSSFAEKVGVKSPNFLKYLISGEKNLSLVSLHKLAKALDFNFDEHQFFEALVLFNQATDTEEIEYYRTRTNQLHKSDASVDKSDKGLEIFGRWYYPAVLVSIHDQEQNLDFKKLSKLLNIDSESIKNSVRYFLSAKIVKVVDGKYQIQNDKLIRTDRNAKSVTMKSFLQQQLQLSQKKLNLEYGGRAKFYSQTITLSKYEFEIIESKIRAHLDDILNTSTDENLEEVCQLNYQFFAL